MRRLLLALALTGAVLLVGTGIAGAQTPTLTVTPESASQFQSVTVAGRDFAPFTPLVLTFFSPAEEEIVYTTGPGPASVTTNRDGRFSVAIVPALDFAGAQAGRWRARVCILDTFDCWEQTFTVQS